MTAAVIVLAVIVLGLFLFWRREWMAHIETFHELSAARIQIVALRAEVRELREADDAAKVKASSRRLLDALGVVDPDTRQ
jgi:hypothetical protein